MHVANRLPGNLPCSENVAYDTVGNTLKVSPQANMNCSENIVFGTTTSIQNRDPVGDILTGHTAVYDEVLPSNN